MLRLCFERLPGFVSIDDRKVFLDWMDKNFADTPYTYGGYIVQNLGDMWYGSNVLWCVMIDNDMDVLARIERSGWIIDGYTVHAYWRQPGHNEIKVPNGAFRISRDEAKARAMV